MNLLLKLRSIFSDTKFDFIGLSKVSTLLSAIFVIASLILVFSRGLNLGIDFTGGILIEARFEKDTSIAKLRDVLSSKIENSQIQNVKGGSANNSDFLIRIPSTNDKQSETVAKIQQLLNDNFSNIQYRKVDYVGPQIGLELIQKGFLALGLSFFFIMIYISMRFDWQFGIGAIITLIHDAILMLGFYSITQLEFNTTSIAALLTVIGYSVNDTVVIFDRIRENLRRFKKAALNDVINSSINSTLSRSVLTSGLTLLSLAALILFGGSVLLSFSLATFFGILIGTYSSIYISSSILLKYDPRLKQETQK